MCPACGANALREYFTIGPQRRVNGEVYVLADYNAHCKDCDWLVDVELDPKLAKPMQYTGL